MAEELIDQYGRVRIVKRGGEYFYSLDAAPGSFAEIIDALLEDRQTEEIMYDGPNQPVKVYHVRFGILNTDFNAEEWDVASFIQELGGDKQFVDANYKGARLNATRPPATENVVVTIRKFLHHSLALPDLVDSGMLSPDAAAFIWTAIDNPGKPCSIIVSGGTASGKTTLLQVLLRLLPRKLRVITIEDTKELDLPQPNIVPMHAEDGISMDDLLKNSLRMRPDRLVVGEVRGAEANTLFSAMNTGHEGCFGTLHANTTKETVTRITTPPMDVPKRMLSSLDLIIVLRKFGSTRVVFEISEIVASADVRFNTLWSYDPKTKKLVSTQIPSRLRERISERNGITPLEFDMIITHRMLSLKNHGNSLIKGLSDSNFSSLMDEIRKEEKRAGEKENLVDRFRAFLRLY